MLISNKIKRVCNKIVNSNKINTEKAENLTTKTRNKKENCYWKIENSKDNGK